MDDKSISRRDFFKEGFAQILNSSGAFAGTVAEIKSVMSNKPQMVRPKPALPEKEFLEKCTRCDECIKVCPEEAVMKWVEAGGENHLTPVMVESRKDACINCKTKECIAACEPGALVH